MKFDRGFIKWQPFNAVVNNKELLETINNEKYESKPILSIEQIDDLNNNIIEAYYGKYNVNITYFETNKIKEIFSSIKKIDSNKHIIELDNHKIISFNQILKITIK